MAYRRITEEERRLIHRRIGEGEPQSGIARRLSRDPGSISREIGRNTGLRNINRIALVVGGISPRLSEHVQEVIRLIEPRCVAERERFLAHCADAPLPALFPVPFQTFPQLQTRAMKHHSQVDCAYSHNIADRLARLALYLLQEESRPL